MPTWFPISGAVTQRVTSSGAPASGYVLKLYQAGTTTNTPMATDSTGATQANYAVYNSTGDVTVSGTTIIPHVDRDYKLAIYPTQAAADANTGATLTIDNILISTVHSSLLTLGVTASAAELNIMDGATLTTAELNYVDGVTSAIQTQLDTKAIGVASAVDSEIALFSSTGGKQLKRATTTGVLVGTSGVLSAAVSGTDVKTINGASILGSGNVTTATGALVYLSLVDASGASTVDVETGFGATYENYLIIAEGIVLSGADAVVARWKLSGAYVTTSTYISSDTAAGTPATSTQTSLPTFSGNITTGGSFKYFISNVNSGIVKTGRCEAQGVNATPGLVSGDQAHYNSGTGALTGIRFYCTGGATITGKFRLYGIATS